MRILPLIFFFCASAHATPSFMAGANNGPAQKGRAALELAPKQKIHLDAGFFETADGQPPKAVDDPEGTYDWQIRCGDDANAGPCAGVKLDDSDRGRDLELVGDAPANLRVLVRHLRADGTPDGDFEFDFAPARADGSPASAARGRLALGDADLNPDETPEPASSGSPFRYQGGSGSSSGNRYHAYEPAPGSSLGGSRSGSRGLGGGGGGGGDDDYSSYRSYRSRRRRSRDDSYDGYYSRGGGYGYGGDGGSPTTKRGYNRDNEVPVVSCKNVTGKDGKNKVVCEDEAHKVLRLKRPKAKPKKPVLAKKPLPKSTKKPASLR